MAQARKKRRSPAAPTQSEQGIIEGFLREAIKGIGNPQVLVLGVTPELRQIALNNGCWVVSVDISSDMIKAMRDLVDCQDRERDKIIQGNWLTVPFEDNTFDLVLGDASFVNLSSFGDAEKLLLKLNRVLKLDGHLLLHELVYLPDKKKTFEQIAADYRAGKTKWPDFYVEMRFLAFFDDFYNPKTKIFPMAEVFREIEKKFKAGEITEQEFQGLKTLDTKVNNLLFLREEFEGLLNRDFSVIAVKSGEEFNYCQYFPAFLAKAKEKKDGSFACTESQRCFFVDLRKKRV